MTPNIMWMMPRITDVFILKELRKVNLLVAMFQICHNPRKQKGITEFVNRILLFTYIFFK